MNCVLYMLYNFTNASDELKNLIKNYIIHTYEKDELIERQKNLNEEFVLTTSEVSGFHKTMNDFLGDHEKYKEKCKIYGFNEPDEKIYYETIDFLNEFQNIMYDNFINACESNNIENRDIN